MNYLERGETVPLTSWIVETAENIGSADLRGLDALHLASAFELDTALTGFVSYDKRLCDAAALPPGKA